MRWSHTNTGHMEYMCIKHAGPADILAMGTTLTFGPGIATAYRVDPCYLGIHGYGLSYEYVIKLRDINSHIVATRDGQLAASQVPLPFYCTKGHEIELRMLPHRLQSKLGLV